MGGVFLFSQKFQIFQIPIFIQSAQVLLSFSFMPKATYLSPLRLLNSPFAIIAFASVATFWAAAAFVLFFY